MPGVLRRIRGLLMQEYFLSIHSLEIVIDTLIFPIMNLVLFGLISQYIGGGDASKMPFLILCVLLWEIIVVNQYNVTVSSLWSIWSHNLTNVFIAPISTFEYMTAQIIAAVTRAIGVVFVLAVGSYFVFDFNLLQVGVVNLILFTINLSVFAWWVGIVLLGFIFRYGVRLQAIAWGTVFVIQPFMAAFYPVSVLPGWMQVVSHAMPATYVFEAARGTLTHSGIDWRYTGIAFALNVVFFIIACFVFGHLFRRSKESGQFARNDL
jgi:ABC-2 type transport system permease protein